MSEAAPWQRAIERARDMLADVDEQLWRTAAPLRTLAPTGGRARALADIIGDVVRSEDAPETIVCLAEGVATFALTQLRVFVDNIFWDFDYPVAAWLTEARRYGHPAAHLQRCLALASALLEQYGPGRGLGFRYAHDFTYGFDWAKWVGRGPAARANLGPFSWEFLQAMEHRGRELQQLIRRGDDAKYPPLPPSTARNPFGFSREPHDELVLHQTLAEQGWIPVQAWCSDAEPVWNRDYQGKRRTVAEAGKQP